MSALDCENPHHARAATIALNAEIAAWHLHGWALLIDARIELRGKSSYPRQSEDGADMVIAEALRRLAETLQAAPAPIPDTPGELLGDG